MAIAGKKSLRLRLSTRLSEATVRQIELSTRFKTKEIRKLHQQFQQIADRDGKLGQDGFRQSMGILGMVQDSILCQRLFSVFNKSGTGFITFEEFAIGLGVLVKGSVDEKLEFAFAMTDIDGSGEITLGELEITVDSIMRIYSGIMGSVNIATLDKTKIRKMFNQLDRNRDGMITLDEYKRGMKQHPEFVASLRGSDLFTVGQNNIIKEGQSRVRRYRRVCRSVMLDVNEAIQLLDAISVGLSSADISDDENARQAAARISGLQGVPITSGNHHEMGSPRDSIASESTLMSSEIDTDWEESDGVDDEDEEFEDDETEDLETRKETLKISSLASSNYHSGTDAQAKVERQGSQETNVSSTSSLHGNGASYISATKTTSTSTTSMKTITSASQVQQTETATTSTPLTNVTATTTTSSLNPSTISRQNSSAQQRNASYESLNTQGSLEPTQSHIRPISEKPVQPLPLESPSGTELIPLDDRLMSVLLTIQAKMQAVLDDTNSKKKRRMTPSQSSDANSSVAVPPGMSTLQSRDGSVSRACSAAELTGHSLQHSQSGEASIPGIVGETRQARSSTESEITTKKRDFVVDQNLIRETLLNSPVAGTTRRTRWSKKKHSSRVSTSSSTHHDTDCCVEEEEDDDESFDDDDDNEDGTNSHIDDAVLGKYLASAQKGSTVFFGHKNWDLVINVMKGIQMAVGRSAAESARPLNQVDFSVKEKYTLVAGSKLGKHSSSKSLGMKDIDSDRSGRSCRFVDYAPVVYCKLREHFGIGNEDYVHSIGPGNMLSNLMLGSLSSLAELGSEGKSGSFFYFTSDGRFMVKTVHKDEHKLLRTILPQYYYHMTRVGSADSLLCRIVGSHVVRLSKNSKIGANKIYFVVMTNMMHTELKIDLRFDLKGSWVGRKEGEAARKHAKSTLKDVDFREMDQKIRIGAERKSKLMEALRRDAAFLEDKHIIDYSLLLGIHKRTQEENASNAAGLSSAQSAVSSRSSATNLYGRHGSLASSSADGEEGDEIDEDGTQQNIPFFQEDDGGMCSEDGSETYVMGVIDFFTQYTSRKVVERFGKGFVYSRDGISVAPPHKYAKRFVDFMDKSIE